MKKDEVVAGVRMDKSLWDKISRIAKRKDRTFSYEARVALKEYAEREKDGK